jgi:hypothetical protein
MNTATTDKPKRKGSKTQIAAGNTPRKAGCCAVMYIAENKE